MVKVGIDTLAIYTPRYALPLAVLAAARGIDADKYQAGLGQYFMSVPPPGEDCVTMAANAAKLALKDICVDDIEMLLFATESGIDQSKAAGIYVHELLGLPSRCRVVELKQACYGGTAGLQLALPYLRTYPNKKVLVIASDIARYGLGTVGESSQGAGAVAMVLSTAPRLLALEPEFGVVTESVMDFWRPNYADEAFVDGKYSSKLYLTMLEKCWQQYQTLSGRHLRHHDYYCYHIPVPRLVEKAHHYLLKINGEGNVPEEKWLKEMNESLDYGRRIGNSYTASLYIGLASLLDNVQQDLSAKRIGFYSYGSGCVAEYFSGVVQAGYESVLHRDDHADLLAERTIITYEEYEKLYQFNYVEDGTHQDIPVYRTGSFRLTQLQQHKRIYEKVKIEEKAATPPRSTSSSAFSKTSTAAASRTIKVLAPGKLILSGEHAVVYGNPALAMAINRYVTATVTHESHPQVLFDLADLAHHSRLSFDALRLLKDRIKRKYHRFIRGDYTIREVLQKPFELAQVALGLFAESLNIPLSHGVKVHVQSDLPIGCGMGSSAATIISVMQAISDYLHSHDLQKPLSTEDLFQLALKAENMQHGRSSGLDLRMAQQGGCLYTQGEHIQTRSIPTLPMYLVNTGKPITTTGQCVEMAASHFQSQQLKEEFAAVTNTMDKALQQQSWSNMRDAVRDNHQLLTRIGVVPDTVCDFIHAIEAEEGAAKICGAGAVLGEQAGAVLVLAQDAEALTALSTRFGYSMVPICGETRGVHAA